MVDWVRFATAVEGSPFVGGSVLSRPPTAPAAAAAGRMMMMESRGASTSPNRTITTAAPAAAVLLSSGADGFELEMAMEKCRSAVRQRRIYFKPYFKDYDPHGLNQVLTCKAVVVGVTRLCLPR